MYHIYKIMGEVKKLTDSYRFKTLIIFDGRGGTKDVGINAGA